AASGAASLAREVARAAGILGDDPIDRIGRVLAQRGPTVLILDNFEQLVPHAPVVAGWLAAGGRTRVVATSREALGLPAERVIDLAPLAADAGCRLFADRVHGALAPTDPGLRAVVERLDGLPLAIELAAARAEDLGTQELLRRLEARLDLLVRRPERSTSHHATLRGAFDASWDLLAPAEKAAFARCAVFVGPFGRPAARAVVGGDPVTADGALDALAARSLIHPASDGRLRLLESLRDYAFEKLLLLGLRVEAESAHRAHHLAVADRAQAVASPLLALRPIRDELLAAYRRAVTPEDRVRTALALDHLLCADGPPDLALELTTAGADHATEVPPALGWDALRASAECERLQGRGDYGCARARAALALAREVDEAAIGSAERQLGLCLRTSGRPGEASEVLRRALDRFRRLGLGRWEAATLSHLARVIHDQAGLDAAAPWFDQACRALTAQSSTLTLARLHGWWGEALMDAGEALRAPPHFDRAEALSRDDPSLAPYLMMRRAEVARWHGDLDLADDLLTQTELAAARVGSTDDSEARALRGAIAIERGDLAVALTLLRSALEMPNQGVGQRSFTSTLLAIVHHLLGRLDEALDGFDASLDVARRSGFRWVPILLGHRAMALADLDRPEAAAALAEAREAALGRSHGVRMFVGLCEAVAALADARAGRLTGPDAMALVDARIADSHVPNAFGGIPAQCDPDVSLAMRILERALDLTEIR
ncbi:MAG: tetratricopeptide repeat protein, partial [Myxococcota bacterium]